MVKNSILLDTVFQALSDPIRRDILRRVTGKELSVGEVAGVYAISLAAVSKHLKVLEGARLVRRRKEGRSYLISLDPKSLEEADRYLERYRRTWEDRYEKLDALLK